MGVELSDDGGLVFTATAGQESGPDCSGWWFVRGLAPEAGGGAWYSVIRSGGIKAGGVGLALRGDRPLARGELVKAGLIPWALAGDAGQVQCVGGDPVVLEWRRRLAVGVVAADFAQVAAASGGRWFGPIMVAGFAALIARGGMAHAATRRPGWCTVLERIGGAAGWYELLNPAAYADGVGLLRPVVGESPKVTQADVGAAGGQLAAVDYKRGGVDFLAPPAGWWRVVIGPLRTGVWVYVTHGGRVAFEFWRELCGCALFSEFGGMAWPDFARLCGIDAGLGPISWRSL